MIVLKAQPLNALFPIDSSLSDNLISERSVQFTNAPSPISVTESGIVIDPNPEHPVNA